MNKDVLNKVDEIIKTIEESVEYKKYLFLQEEMKKNKRLISLLNEVRVLQKDFVHHLIKKEDLDNKISELNNYPLYREYKNSLDELNNTYRIIENKINKYFQNKLN